MANQYTPEQIAGMLLTLLKATSNPAAGQLVALSGLWEGGIYPKIRDNSLPQNPIPPRYAELFNEARHILVKNSLIKAAPRERGMDVVVPTEEGYSIEIFENFELAINRNALDIFNHFKDFVFRLAAIDDKGERSAACFLTHDKRIVTCKRNISNAKSFKIYFNAKEHMGNDCFDIQYDEKLNIAILYFKNDKLSQLENSLNQAVFANPKGEAISSFLRNSEIATSPTLLAKTPSKGFCNELRLKEIIKDLKGIRLFDKYFLEPAEKLIVIGYPATAKSDPAIQMQEIQFSHETKSFESGETSLTFVTRLPGGFTGSPVISLKRNCVGMISAPIDPAGNTGKLTGNNASTYAIPSRDIIGYINTR